MSILTYNPGIMRPHVVTEVPGPKTLEAMGRGEFDMQAPYRALIVDDTACRDVYLVDLDGNVFLDLFANFALGALGYNHPRLTATAERPEFRAAVVNPTSTPFLTAPQWLDYVQALEARFAPRWAKKVFCVDGGGEAVESALKAAFIVHGEHRRAALGESVDPLGLPAEVQDAILNNRGNDAVVVSFSGAFHGRGLGPLSATHSKVIHKADLPCFAWPTVPFPAKLFPEEKFAERNAQLEAECLAELYRVLSRYKGRVAAVLVEPVQSEGGDRHANPSFFQKVGELARDAGAAFILDEVQTGMGISGSLWAHEQLDLQEPPDLLVFGKKMQLGGFFAGVKHNISQFGRMYQTRNGDRAKGMLAMATLEAIVEDDLLTNVRETGSYFLKQLRALESDFPRLIDQVRGLGLLIAFDLPTAAARNAFNAQCLRRGVFVTYTGTRSVRLRPHLTTRPEHVDQAIEVFRDVLMAMT